MKLLHYMQYIFEEENTSSQNKEVKVTSQTQELPWTAEVKKDVSSELWKVKVDPALAWLEEKAWVADYTLEHKKVRIPNNFSEMVAGSNLEKDFSPDFFEKVNTLVLQYTDSVLWRILAPAQRNQVKNTILVAIMKLYTNPNRKKSQEWVATPWDKKEKKSRTDIILNGFSSKSTANVATIAWPLQTFRNAIEPPLKALWAVGIVKDVVTMTGNITEMFVYAKEDGLILENWALDTKKVPNASWNNSLVADGRKLAARSLSQKDITTKSIITKDSYSTYFTQLFSKDVSWIETKELWNTLSTVINTSKNPAELKKNITDFVGSAWSKLSEIQAAWKTMLKGIWATTVVDELKKIVPPRASTLLGFIFGNGSGEILTKDVEDSDYLEDEHTNTSSELITKLHELDSGLSLSSLSASQIKDVFYGLFGAGKASDYIAKLWINAMRNALWIAWAENWFKISWDIKDDTKNQKMKWMFCISTTWWDNAVITKYNSCVWRGKKVVWYEESDELPSIQQELCSFIGHMNDRNGAMDILKTLEVKDWASFKELGYKVQGWEYNSWDVVSKYSIATIASAKKYNDVYRPSTQEIATPTHSVEQVKSHDDPLVLQKNNKSERLASLKSIRPSIDKVNWNFEGKFPYPMPDWTTELVTFKVDNTNQLELTIKWSKISVTPPGGATLNNISFTDNGIQLTGEIKVLFVPITGSKTMSYEKLIELVDSWLQKKAGDTYAITIEWTDIDVKRTA